MAEEKQTENLDSRDAAVDENPQASENRSEEKTQNSNEGKDSPGNRINTKKRGRWLKLSLFLLLIAAIAFGAYRFKPEWFKRSDMYISGIDTNSIENDNLMEKKLSTLFIPPSEGINSSMIRIDLSVIWDGLAEVRYQSKRLQIRDDIFRYLSSLSEKTEDLNTEIDLIEAELSMIFSNTLGVKNRANH